MNANAHYQQQISLTPAQGRALLKAQRPRQTGPADWADVLLQQIRALHLPEPVREYRPWPDRRFRIDLAWVERKIACEVDGAEWSAGRHGRGAGMRSDCYKQNRLVSDGWKVYRFTGSMVRAGDSIAVLEAALKTMTI